MNRQEIIDMAIEAGFRAPTPSDGCMGLAFDFRDGTDTGASLEKFATLVAAKERERCKAACEEVKDKSRNSLFRSGAAICSGAMDVHSILREAAAQKTERAEQLPGEQDCIRVMVQARLRLQELGWSDITYAPKDGTYFESITAGFAGPADCCHLGSGFFIAEGGDLWPAKPMMYRLKAQS